MALQLIRVNGSKGFWNTNVKLYYLTKTKLLDLITHTMKDHEIAQIPALGIYSSLKKCKDSGMWEYVLCDFGECCSSWHLEEKEGVYFVTLRWVLEPLVISSGVDLIGIKLPSRDVCYAEAKTRNDTDISSAVTELSTQLSKERLNACFENPWGRYGSLIWLAKRLREEETLTEEEIKGIEGKTVYLRYGFVFHPKRTKPASFDVAKKMLDDGGGLTTLFDYEMEDLEYEIVSFMEVMPKKR